MPALPAQSVHAKRLLERRRKLFPGAGERYFDGAYCFELSPTTASHAARLRREFRLPDGLPAGAQLENGSLEPFDQPEISRRQSSDKPARSGEPVEIREVVIHRARPLCKGSSHDRLVLAACNEDVGEKRPSAHELGDSKTETSTDREREGADESIAAIRHVDRELAIIRVVPPPLTEPGVQQERARACHGENEVVPDIRELRELLLRRERPDAHVGARLGDDRHGMNARHGGSQLASRAGSSIGGTTTASGGSTCS